MAQRKFIIDGGFKTDDASELLANLTMGGSMLPNVDSNGVTGFDLGSTSMKWRDLYLSQGSLYIDGQKVLESDSGTIVVQADTDQGITVKAAGTGVLTLDSATTVNMNGTLQMQAGKNITDVSGISVGFGDKINMNNNNIINVGTAVNGTDVANKTYVDLQVANLVNGAPGAMDTLNELANALGDDANFSTTITNSVAANAADIVTANTTITNNATQIAANMTAISDNNTAIGLRALTTYVDSQDTSLQTAMQSYADTAEADAISTSATAFAAADVNVTNAFVAADVVVASNASTDATTKADAAQTAAESTASSDATTKANAAQAAAEATAVAADVVVTSAFGAADSVVTAAFIAADTATLSAAESYADVTESNAILSAAGDATTKADAAQAAAISTAASDATTKANAAQAAAISSAASDATTKANAAQSAAASDATTKANAAQSAAQSFATSAIDTLVDSAPGTLNTLNELAAALGDDANYAASVTTAINAAQTAAQNYADANDANTTYSVGDGGLTEHNFTTADHNKLNGIAASATNVTNNNQLTNGAGYITTYTDTNTTYSAGNGMSLSGTQFLMSGSYTGSFTATGDITAYSDESLKTNIQVIDGALGKVEAIRGVTFDRIEDGSTSTGVVAHELEAVLPEAVHTDSEGLKSVAYGNITGLLIEAVKELSAQVAELKAK